MSSRTQLLTPSNLRLDSRLPLELRQLSLLILPSPATTTTTTTATGVPTAGCDGYSSCTHGLTRVTSSVFGPREPNRAGGPFSNQSSSDQQATGPRNDGRAQINVQVGTAGWAERSATTAATSSVTAGVKKGGKDRRTIELAAAIKATFEPVVLLHLYPRSTIDIYLQIFEVDGSLLQAAINATTLALISAGLPLSDYICALSLASYPSISPSAPPQVAPFQLTSPPVAHSNADDGTIGSGSTTMLDLTQAEEQALPNITVAVLPRSGKVTLVNLETRVGVGRFEEMLRWGVQGAQVVKGAMEDAVNEWAASLAAPTKGLGNLYPGIVTGKNQDDGHMSE